MANNRYIKDNVWEDGWVFSIVPEEKLVWIFLLVNSENNIAGIYKLNRSLAAQLVGLDVDVFNGVIKHFEYAKKIITCGEWIILVNFHKHQSVNPKVEAGVVRIIKELPAEVIKVLPMDSLCIAYPTLLNFTLLNANRVTNENAGKSKIMLLSPILDDDGEIEAIAQFILSKLHDRHSLQYYRLIAARISEHEIRRVLSEIEHDKEAKSPAKVFVSEMEKLAAELLTTRG